MYKLKGWIGVDLDGTLAEYDVWRGLLHIGKPIEPMVNRVNQWIKDGRRVKIMTARVTHTGFAEDRNIHEIEQVISVIDDFCMENFGTTLEVTNVKDFFMEVLYDDRARQVEFNTGRIIE